MAGSQGEKGFNPRGKDGFNFVYALAKGHAMCFLPFMRRNFGSEALGWPGVYAFGIMVVVGSFGRIPDMWFFLGLWMLVVLAQRLSTMRAMLRGVVRHSRYEGDVDTKWCKNRRTVKLVLEPLVCAFLGVCVEAAGLSHGLAVFVGSGAFSLAMTAMIDRGLEDKRLQAMRDAAIEQQYLAARFRDEID